MVRQKVFFMLLVWLYFGAAVHMTFRLPATATPNEILNYEYILVMRQIRGLPNRGLLDSEVRYSEWHQPPLYFVWSALVSWGTPVEKSPVNPPPSLEEQIPLNPFFTSTHRGNLNPAIHVTPANHPILYSSRLAATLMGVTALAALYFAGKSLYTPSIALLMCSLLAFQPNFIHLSGSVNNDMPLTVTVTWAKVGTALLVAKYRSPRQFLGLGVLCALALLTKANGIFVLAYIGIAALVVREATNPTSKIKHLLFILARVSWALLALVPAYAWWVILNAIRMKDALGVEGSLPVDRVLRLFPTDFAILLPHAGKIWQSFWLDWSAGDIGYAGNFIYIFWAAFYAIALLGLWRYWVVSSPRGVHWVVGAGIAGIAYLYLAVKTLMVKEAGFLVPEARWVLPALPGLAWLAAVGWARWLPTKWRESIILVTACIPPLFAYSLLATHLPYLYPHAKLIAEADAYQNAGIVYDNQLTLLGVSAPEQWQVGKDQTITLDWYALQNIETDYTISAQLLVQHPHSWQKLDEQNSYAGNGLNPTKGWQADEVYRDQITFVPQGELYGPTLATIGIWLQTPTGSVAMSKEGQPLDQPFVQNVVVRPESPLTTRNSTIVVFGDIVQLLQVERLNDHEVAIWWQALSSPEKDYTVFVHLLDDAGNVIAQADSPPNFGQSPTRIWQRDDVIRDRHVFAEPISANATLLIGFYDPATGERLPAYNPKPLTNNAFLFSLNN